jgi:hypothetical protein
MPSPTRSPLWTALGAAAMAACGMSDPAPFDNRGLLEGQSVAKFCHDLHRSNANIDLTLEFGNPPLARITATSGNCTPPLGEMCTMIPVGLVPLRLMEGDRELASGAIRLSPNLEYVFAAVVSAQTGMPTVRNGVFKPEFKCALTDPRVDVDGGSDAGEAGTMEAGAQEAGNTDAGAPDAAVDAAASD